MIRVARELKRTYGTKTLIILPEQNSASFRANCSQYSVDYRTSPLTCLTRNHRQIAKYLACSMAEIRHLARLIRLEGCDIVHASGGCWQYKAVLAASIAGVPKIWHLNDTAAPKIAIWIFRALQSLADGFIFASHRTEKYYTPFTSTSKPSWVIPACVDTSEFSPQTPAKRQLQKPSISKYTLIGTLANTSPVKGLSTFIKMAAKINQTHSQRVKFTVAGEVFDSQREHFQELQRLTRQLGVSNLQWIQPKQKVKTYLDDLDVYVCTSNAESSPLAVWEALAMSKPVVSTDVGDVSRYVRPGLNGFLAAAGDYKTLAEKVLLLISSPEMLINFGVRSRKIACDFLDVTKCGQSHQIAYEEVLSRQRIR
jgi:glycosyltransferase involved in cell wall biosynthesis